MHNQSCLRILEAYEDDSFYVSCILRLEKKFHFYLTLEESTKVSLNQREISDHQYCIFSAALESVVAANTCIILHCMTWSFCNRMT